MSFGHLILIFFEIFFEMAFLSKNAFSTANCLKLIFFWSSLKNILKKKVNNKKIMKDILIAYEKLLSEKNKFSFVDLKRKYK